jgi:hypothetical protein
LPKASWPTVPGTMLRGKGRGTSKSVVKVGGVVVRCRLDASVVKELAANAVLVAPGPSRKSAGAGSAACIWSRIRSRIAVTLRVVKTLATTMSPSWRPAARAADRASRSAFR